MVGEDFNCGNCGAELPRHFRHSRMIACQHCGSTSVLRDDAFELAGEGGIMQDAPSLIELGQMVRVDGERLTPIGHARFSYGRGWWDEFWCMEARSDQGVWLSVDEGDYALERDLTERDWPSERNLSLGQSVMVNGLDFTVTEAENATCLAVRGEFPEVLEVGETHLYFDLSSGTGGLATYELWDGGRSWSVGRWVDPWDVVRV